MAQKEGRKVTETVVTIIARVDHLYLGEIRDAIEQIRGYGTIVKAEAVVPAETVIDLANGG